MSKRDTAAVLARSHFDVEPNLRRVFILEPVNEQDPEDPIRLLEVVEGTIERGIEPIAFTADPNRGVDYPLVIVEISPREYEEIRDGKIDLGSRGWSIGTELLAG
jgi:hypothetical protein